MNAEERIAAVALWRHQIPLPGGLITPGTQNTLEQLRHLGLADDLRGKSVLDIGCSDGFFSFECEKRGAARVVAIDDFSSVYIDSAAGFHAAREILGSKVEFVPGDFLKLDLASLGMFDIVLFLGVMYHLRHPLYALERLAEVCREQIIVETEIVPPRRGWKWKLLETLIGRTMPESYMEFAADDRINRDPTNWWVQSPVCVEEMLRSCGFCNVKTVHRAWTRGIFHGFSPRHGSDRQELWRAYSPDLLREACSRVLGEQQPDLESLSVTEFGAIKQTAAELKAKEWHQKGAMERPQTFRLL